MKLYPTATNLYVKESGRIRTATSEVTFRKELASLQARFPDHHLTDFTTEELTWFCLSRHDGKEGQPAPKTVRRRRSYIMIVFEWFKWKKLIKENPAVDLKFTVVPGKGKVRIGQWLVEADVREIFRAFDDSDPVQRRNRLILLFGISTGWRAHEMAQLTWDKFTSDLRQVRIVGKGSKPADITIPPQLREALLAWRKEAWMGAKAVFPSVKERFDFGQLKRRQTLNWDQPLGTDGLRFVVRKAGDVIGVRLNPHDLRRSFAGILEAKGVPLKDIQLALRHGNLATTDTYLSNNPARAHKTANGLQFEL